MIFFLSLLSISEETRYVLIYIGPFTSFSRLSPNLGTFLHHQYIKGLILSSHVGKDLPSNKRVGRKTDKGQIIAMPNSRPVLTPYGFKKIASSFPPCINDKSIGAKTYIDYFLMAPYSKNNSH